MRVNESEVRNIITKAVCGPCIEIDDKIVPVFKPYEETAIDKIKIAGTLIDKDSFSEDTELSRFEAAESQRELELKQLLKFESPIQKKIYTSQSFIKATNKFGEHSPNMVQAIRIGTDSVIKTYFTGEEFRYSFGREGRRLIEEVTYIINNKQMSSIKMILGSFLVLKLYNVEEIYIDNAILAIAGMDIRQLRSLSQEQLLNHVKSEKFNSRLFGRNVSVYDEFKRLKVLSLGERTITIAQHKGYWKARENEDGVVELYNNNWVIEDKVYKKDNELFNMVYKGVVK